MKTLTMLLKEIKGKDKKAHAKIEKQINSHAHRLGLLEDDPKTEHPVKPPTQP